jgi:flavin-dependent dehydrogenase
MPQHTNGSAAQPDVIVIGGGPAGSTVSTLLAQQGYRVQLFEREHFPRFHIGESLIPQTYWILHRLKMLDKMKSSRFVKKYSVQFVNQHGKLSEPFYFIDYKPHESSQTWQVVRGEFDWMLLKNAEEQGVVVQQGVRVLQVIFDGERAIGVRLQYEDGREREVQAKVIVDASGQSSVLMDRLSLRQWDAELRKAALWTYWKSAQRDTGRDEGATLVLQVKDKKAWFWYIPQHEDIISVGVVGAYDYLFMTDRQGKDLETIYFEEVERCPGLQPRLKNAQRVAPYRAAKEYSYRSRRAAGPGWVLVGDAFGFLDPLYSSGVLLALRSGEMAADAVAEGLACNDTSATQLGKWESTFVKGMDRMRRLVVEFYNGLSFGRFVRRYPELKDRVTDVLVGDLFKDEVDQIWEPIEKMKSEDA